MRKNLLIIGGLMFLGISSVKAAESNVMLSEQMFTLNNLWILIATVLVFIMHLGFATLEAGLTRAKNCVNILFKNVMTVAIGLLTFALVGFNIMYPGNEWTIVKWFGFAGFGLNCPEGAAGLINYNGGNYSYYADFIFQGMFAATAATIISGAVAERMKLTSYLIFCTLFVGIVYPIVGSWGWGGGWLSDLGFKDFAGSAFVHSVGGWGALAGVMLLGPRSGKYVLNQSKAIMGHNMPLAAIGVFMLWMGWFGFNGGSVFSADPEALSLVFVTTTMSAVAGIATANITSWIISKKPDLSMVLNGCLAGLVGITACADAVTVNESLIIGAVSGVIVVLAVLGFDKVRLDDPVGALSVHLVCGTWSVLATGIFCEGISFATQLIGVVVIGIVSFASAYAIFGVLKVTLGIRVHKEEELRGLDIGEHGLESYSGFQIFDCQ
ncbi:ammonium transporter [Lentisphaerota bacterium WC36G]|nr:ammonium transporter [Lentisphaerae bacterium WC36]